MSSSAVLLLATLVGLSGATSVTDIQGVAFQSPLAGQNVTNVTGIVTAKSKSGFWILGEASDDERASNGLSIYTSSNSTLDKVSVGDEISLSGQVSEYRSSSQPNDLFLTELNYPTDIKVLSSNNTVKPLVLGTDRSPPTAILSALDKGDDGWLTSPGNTSRVETKNATLQPDKYGLDFWESLEGQIVTVPKPTTIEFGTEYGEIWVYGDWNVTGKNSRGGLTITADSSGVPDANPETILVGTPLDGTKNPDTGIGSTLSDITGVITFQYGFYYILPTTAPTVKSTPSIDVSPSNITSSDAACTITLGDYNIDNMAPNSTTMAGVGEHIAKFLNTPDILFIQEIQDNSGPTDDGTVNANKTLDALVSAIVTGGGAFNYSYTDIDPIDGEDGGEPGGNIRQVYLYNPKKVTLVPGSPVGGALNDTEVTGSGTKVGFSYNPGRIDPTNAAWKASRKPLAAAWQTQSGKRFYTVNVQLTAKLGSSATEGDARTPVNGGVDQRTSQIGVITSFVNQILAKNADANLIVGGDFNEYLQTTQVFSNLTSILTDADEVASIENVERYTYTYDQNSQQLDHIFVSDAIKSRGLEAEHVHVNSWAKDYDARSSDHDPTVVSFKICE
ncbi:hypothetical protein PLICRDRAFT_113396 [Plicaturopsis crispa FD-325 SS-3]|nr:hypothetical protein PLICRDRAFT_113396 [Plicaturopsis crispa FD-325 SS-3]